MKMTRKLIPAFVMLIVSAIMLSTASYAWFANSTSVNATGMTVKANTDVKFLEISTSNDSGWASFVTLTATDEDLDLVTAKVSENKEVTWHTGTAALPTAPTVNDTGLVSVPNIKDPDANLALIQTLYVRMSNEQATLSNLVITGVEVTNGTSTLSPTLRVLVIAKNSEDEVQGVQVWDVGDTDPQNLEEAGLVNSDNIKSSSALVSEIANGDVYTLEVYVYFDGEDKQAYTDKAASGVLSQVVTVTFGGQ